MQTIEKLLTYPEITDAEVEELLQKASEIVIGNLDDFTESFQRANSVNGFYEKIPNASWTTGFWTEGLIKSLCRLFQQLNLLLVVFNEVVVGAKNISYAILNCESRYIQYYFG